MVSELLKQFGYLGPGVVEKILSDSEIREIPRGTELVREEQYVKVVPIVISGLIKVFTRSEEKELLLYYIQPGESCIMSFSACLKNEKSRIFAFTEEDSRVILLPSGKLTAWVTEFPAINRLFYQQFDLRYSELISTINHLLYDKLDKRLLKFLAGRSALTGRNPIRISHREIAAELGTAREVVSRLLKKLEKEKRVKLDQDGIEIL